MGRKAGVRGLEVGRGRANLGLLLSSLPAGNVDLGKLLTSSAVCSELSCKPFRVQRSLSSVPYTQQVCMTLCAVSAGRCLGACTGSGSNHAFCQSCLY